MHRTQIAAIAVAAMSATALASLDTNGYEIRVSNVVSPGTPSTTVEVWADWDSPTFFAFAAAEFDLSADTSGMFSGPASAFSDPGQEPGDIEVDGVENIVVGQLQFPPGGLFADTSDPILVWSATWSTTDFSTRSVPLATITDQYTLYTGSDGSSSDVTMTVIEATGAIRVIPAPASLALLGLGGLAAARRRR
ncbi:MAG: PEP-CTERM sorting domain-containing protein [Planctomycetota bacterium]